VVGARVHGCMGVAVLGAGVVALSACSYLPAAQEKARAEEILATVDSVSEVQFSCGGRVLARDSLCAEVVTKDGAKLRFERVGFNSFGSTAANVYVVEAGGLVPRVASCEGVGAPNFHRDSPLGHHFHPTLIDVKDAVFRYREVLEEVEFWPQCPQYWEVQDRRGRNYRYCAHRKDASEDPPLPAGCATL
jgi:hypothetical protein